MKLTSDNTAQPEFDPFSAPIPGQSLTDEPGNYPWEHAPLITDPEQATEFIWDRLHKPEFAEQVIAMLDAGIPVEALGRVILFGGFMEGKFSPDVAFIIAQPVMEMIASMGVAAGVEKFRMSMSDLTNNKQMTEIIKIKQEKEEFEKIVRGVKQDIKKVKTEDKGLMAKPEEAE